MKIYIVTEGGWVITNKDLVSLYSFIFGSDEQVPAHKLYMGGRYNEPTNLKLGRNDMIICIIKTEKGISDDIIVIDKPYMRDFKKFLKRHKNDKTYDIILDFEKACEEN